MNDDKINFSLNAMRWLDTESGARCYAQDKTRYNPKSYIIGDTSNYNVYSLKVAYWYSSEGDSYSITISATVLFWAKTDNPISELTERLIKFQDVQARLLCELTKQGKNPFNYGINHLPMELTDRNIYDHVLAFMQRYDTRFNNVLTMPFIDFAVLLESSHYKYQKMLQLYNQITELFNGELFDYLIENYS